MQLLALQVHQRLLEFYGQPTWRNPLPPLDELVSTILSQNTNDLNRDRAFNACAAVPHLGKRARCRPGAVIDAIRPAGLANQKGPRIQQVLREITAERGSLDLGFLEDLPLEEARGWLMKFKGVGPKTAAIVLCFSLGRPAFPVDTHIYRVSGRMGLRPEKMSVEQAHPHLEALFPPGELLRRPPEHHPPGTRDVRGAQTRLRGLPAAGAVPLCPGKLRNATSP